jgi:hypothetical protein
MPEQLQVWKVSSRISSQTADGGEATVIIQMLLDNLEKKSLKTS